MFGSTETIIVGFMAGVVGFSFFLYGKKQQRPVPLASGILLMVAPMMVTDALWLALGSVALSVATVVIERR